MKIFFLLFGAAFILHIYSSYHILMNVHKDEKAAETYESFGYGIGLTSLILTTSFILFTAWSVGKLVILGNIALVAMLVTMLAYAALMTPLIRDLIEERGTD